MSNLLRPNFVERSPSVVEAAAIALFEQILDKTLYPGQPERLLLNALVYRETLTRIALQDAAEQNLVNYARAENLDQLGALLDVVRLPEAKAQTTIQFTRSPILATPLLIPKGTRVSAQGGQPIFATLADATILANQGSVSAIAEATDAGVAGNGFTAGQINLLLDPISGAGLTAANTSISNSGADTEKDDRFRERIKLAPNKFSVAGSVGAYQFWTLTADSTIIDAAIVSPFPTRVEVYPLAATGIPSNELISKVSAVLSSDKIRPLTDELAVLPPTQQAYQINASITLLASSDTASLSDQIQAAAEVFAADRRAGLGRDVMRSQLTAALSLSGVYNVLINSPSNDLIVSPSEWANCTGISITITGTNAG